MLSGDNAIEFWEQVREKLRIEAGETVFNNWLGLLSLSSFSDGKIVLAVHSKFHRDWIEPRYGNRIRTLWQGFSKDIVSVSLIVDERLAGKTSSVFCLACIIPLILGMIRSVSSTNPF